MYHTILGMFQTRLLEHNANKKTSLKTHSTRMLPDLARFGGQFPRSGSFSRCGDLVSRSGQIWPDLGRLGKFFFQKKKIFFPDLARSGRPRSGDLARSGSIRDSKLPFFFFGICGIMCAQSETHPPDPIITFFKRKQTVEICTTVATQPRQPTLLQTIYQKKKLFFSSTALFNLWTPPTPPQSEWLSTIHLSFFLSFAPLFFFSLFSLSTREA